ncbi:MAG: hypothetical protein LBS09_04805 [Bacteroidales bacterium]|jgi:hypothetical protein|nr:hypothetical protein [Bacteroidales bacterium]
MNAVDYFYRIRNLLLRPGAQWAAVASCEKDNRAVYREIVLPAICLIAVCTALGALLFVSRAEEIWGYIVRKILLLACSLSAGLYLSAFLVNALMILHIGPRNMRGVFSLMAHTAGVIYPVIAVVALFPFFSELSILAFYAIYVYWRGIPHMLSVGVERRPIFMVVSLAAAAAVHLLIFYFFGQFLTAVIQ